MKRVIAIALSVLLHVGLPTPTRAHHVGVFTPKDNDITKNFKDIKFASQAGRFDVAARLFDEGVIHATMEKFEKALPPDLEDGLRAALGAKSLPGVELRLAVFLAVLTKERVLNAMERLEDPSLPRQWRRDQTRKLLDAAWRYYNLADFVISRQDPKASVDLRTAFEDAQTYLGRVTVEPVGTPGVNPNPTGPKLEGVARSGRAIPPPAGPDDGKALAALTLMERTLGEVIREGAQTARTGQAKAFLPGR